MSITKKNKKKPTKKENEYHVSYVNVCKRLHTSTKVEVREYHELWLRLEPQPQCCKATSLSKHCHV